MTKENQDRFVTWIWIVGVLLGMVMVLGGILLNDTRASIKFCEDKKLDKEQYYRDINQINSKLDEIIKIHMQQPKGSR